MTLEDIGKDNLINNRGILRLFENIATYHSDLVGFGINDINKSGYTWILLYWKVKVIKRVKYSNNLHISTWARHVSPLYTYRDYEIYDENNEVCIIGTSKWVLFDITKNKIAKITDEIINVYEPEEKALFTESEIGRIKCPNNYISEIKYTAIRKDIDINNHMHNLYYLDLAYEALPNEVYENSDFNNFSITYKKEIKLYDTVACKYSFYNNTHIISIYSKSEKDIHAIITLY